MKKTTFFWIFFFGIFFIKGIFFLDPDFGWRLRSGEIYVTSGIPKTDPFSYTVPTFAWVDHAWSISAIIFLVYSKVGYIGLAFLFAGVATVTVYILSLRLKPFTADKRFYSKMGYLVGGSLISPRFINLSYDKLNVFASFVFWLAISILFTFFGIRAQVFSWLMLSSLLLVIFNERLWKKWKTFLPIFFFIWANLHGSFLSGLVVVFLVLVSRFVGQKRISFSDSVIFIVSSLSTLVNPYGLGIWREVLSSVLDSSLRWKIIEWMPALTMLDLSMVFLIGISLALSLRYVKKFQIEELVLYFFFLVQATLSRRHLPLWAIIATPVAVKAIYFLWQDAKKFKNGTKRFNVLYKWGFVATLVVVILQMALSFNEAWYLGRGGFYPEKAVEYLRQNAPAGEIFSDYGWGGYLVWKLPEKKVFIDGRMPSWRSVPQNESELSSVFETYNDILSGEKDYKKIFDRFKVSTVLSAKKGEESPLDKFYKKVESFLNIFGRGRNDFNFLEKLKKDNWAKIYEDDVAVVYERQ